ncbi:ubiquitin-conjugating enzyme E2 D/E, putative [Rhizoctonia solani AG-3 Rhs1AP]|uniref:Ubiquitin-conjugating enzyme E2 D/E, putative n=2 Tax=Rhizoctonia solani AG-3 TaxID=1086053 RepID=X8JCR1_9AGAM|nr:ubiquitin-conjugating enzyme E2 D/E, putative [Rhizoctonia solani AG-3 Rhs1AP]KEP53749.1 putative ubiquitin-conjugating enzyme E2 D/E [Rhizoctonia solani 123E]
MSYLNTMSHPQLSSFDPFAAHPFTSGGTPPGGSPLQTPTLRAQDTLPSPDIRSPSQSPVSSPMDMPPAFIHAPKPTFKSPAQAVFEQYDRGRVTPDLVVRQKINSWSIQPSSR